MYNVMSTQSLGSLGNTSNYKHSDMHVLNCEAHYGKHVHLQFEQLGQQNKLCVSEETALQPVLLVMLVSTLLQNIRVMVSLIRKKVAGRCCLGYDDWF